MLNLGNSITTIPGWLSGIQDKVLFNLTAEYNNTNTVGVEIGSLHGRSSYIISTAIPLGKLYCIDLWDGKSCFSTELSNEVSKKYYNPTDDMYKTLEFFLENVKDRTNIFTIKGSSPSCVQDWDTLVDFVFLDAEHKNPSDMDNINFWLPKIKPGGMFIGHDADYDDVVKNIKYLENLLEQSVTIVPKTSIYYFKIPINLIGKYNGKL